MQSEPDRGRVIATWYYEQTPDEGGVYSQVRGDSASETFRDTYRRCIATFFMSARRANPSARLVLILNRSWRVEASVVSREVAAILENLDVQVLETGYSFSPPDDWTSKWRNQFFLIDVLECLVDTSAEDDRIIVADSDVIWTSASSGEEMWTELNTDCYLAYSLDYQAGHDINGLTRTQLAGLVYDLADVKIDTTYFGGEFIGGTARTVTDLVRAAHQYWPAVLQRHSDSLPNFTEEAHYISFLLTISDREVRSANRYVKRIWTQVFKYQNSGETDLRLAVWHLPAEKKFGLKRLYKKALKPGWDGLLEAPDELFIARVGATVGIPFNRPGKILRDTLSAGLNRAIKR